MEDQVESNSSFNSDSDKLINSDSGKPVNVSDVEQVSQKEKEVKEAMEKEAKEREAKEKEAKELAKEAKQKEVNELAKVAKEAKEKEAMETKKREATPTGRKEINNPFEAATSKVSHLVHWENPIHSGIVLATGLSVIIYTSYYSLISTYFALIISLLGLNWIIVIGKKQFQALSSTEYTNPFESLIDKQIFERAKIEKYLNIFVDGVEFLLLEYQKVILVEDPSRTFKFIVFLYSLWTILGWFSIRTLASIVLVLGFSVPTIYRRKQEFFDEKLNKMRGISNSYCERATGLLKQHTKGVVEKGRNYAVTKGWATKEE
ncbi:hypothetical protein Glove_53g95 [Diversispora epigaea]|uniref:Reticulon-like protein n=1 Tax=Diversispora epigaea TaxID=1348612 RepID=A0A397JDW7_9GLOM|nr:hypothetical protein Glove_53g95 [Diversispora epigaea]